MEYIVTTHYSCQYPAIFQYDWCERYRQVPIHVLCSVKFSIFFVRKGGGGGSGGQQDFLCLTATGTEHSDHGLRPLVYLLWQTDYCLEFVWNSCLVTFRVIKTKPILTGIYTVHLIKKTPKFPGRDHIHNNHFECMLTISNLSTKFQFSWNHICTVYPNQVHWFLCTVWLVIS